MSLRDGGEFTLEVSDSGVNPAVSTCPISIGECSLRYSLFDILRFGVEYPSDFLKADRHKACSENILHMPEQ